jgi:hypothetical protein
MVCAMSMLDEVLRRISVVRDAGLLPVVVFDLDSTLFNTAGRHLKILQEFAATRGDAAFSEVVAEVRHAEFGWSISGPLKRRDITDEALHKALFDFWFERFFTDAYVLHDLCAEGAVAYANKVHEAGAMVYYLTGRHVDGMGVGTVRALTAAGFPLWRGRTTLHLKPGFTVADKEFKTAAVRDIRSTGQVVATFDNEPENVNLLRQAFPNALHVLFE